MPNIMGITETWLTPFIPDSAVCLPNYTISVEGVRAGTLEDEWQSMSETSCTVAFPPNLHRWFEELSL